MELKTLRAFVEVVRQGGFSQAARTVHASQPTVSKAIQQLEADLGMVLLDRGTHRLAVTEAGQIVYRRALAMLAERDDLLAELDGLRGLTRGTLRLGLPLLGSGTHFAPLFIAFRTRYPGIEITLREQGSKLLEESLLAGEIDLGASLFPVPDAFEGQSIASEPLLVLLARNHPLASRPSLTLEDLRDTPFILFTEGFALNPLLLGACQRRGFVPRVAARSSQVDFIVELAGAGLGAAFLPRSMAEPLANPDVLQCPLDEPGTAWRMAMIWRRGGYLSPAARAWLALIRDPQPSGKALA